MSFLQTVLFSKHFNFYFLALYAPIFLTELQNRGIAPSSILQSYFLIVQVNQIILFGSQLSHKKSSLNNTYFCVDVWRRRSIFYVWEKKRIPYDWNMHKSCSTTKATSNCSLILRNRKPAKSYQVKSYFCC